MSLLEAKKDFTKRELMWFGPLFALFVALICYLFLWDNLRPAITYAVAGVSACLILLYYLIPPARLPIYRGWLYSVMPIGWVISHVLLTAIYFLIFTPVAMVMRLCGYDPLQRKFERDAKTYWIRREANDDPQRYLRQF